MKVSSNLERIADHAVSIARRAKHPNSRPAVWEVTLLELPYRLAVMIFRDSIRAFVDGDSELAAALKRKDRELDALTDDLNEKLVERASSDSELHLPAQFIPRYNRASLECRLRSCVRNPPLISIIDDDESVRESLSGLVRSVGFVASTFASAEEFVKSDQLGNADCLIIDVCMPGMSGIELQRQLVGGHSEVPVIFITAHEDEGMRAQALNGGAEAVLIKPFSEEALLNAIQAALSPQ